MESENLLNATPTVYMISAGIMIILMGLYYFIMYSEQMKEFRENLEDAKNRALLGLYMKKDGSIEVNENPGFLISFLEAIDVL